MLEKSFLNLAGSFSLNPKLEAAVNRYSSKAQRDNKKKISKRAVSSVQNLTRLWKSAAGLNFGTESNLDRGWNLSAPLNAAQRDVHFLFLLLEPQQHLKPGDALGFLVFIFFSRDNGRMKW